MQLCVHTCICTQTLMHTYIDHTSIHVHAHQYTHFQICMYPIHTTLMHTHAYFHTHTYHHTCTNTLNTHVHRHAYCYICTHASVHTYTYIYGHMSMLTSMNTFTHQYISIYQYIGTHAHSYWHTCTFSCVHTSTLIHMPKCLLSLQIAEASSWHCLFMAFHRIHTP